MKKISYFFPIRRRNCDGNYSKKDDENFLSCAPNGPQYHRYNRKRDWPKIISRRTAEAKKNTFNTSEIPHGRPAANSEKWRQFVTGLHNAIRRTRRWLLVDHCLRT